MSSKTIILPLIGFLRHFTFFCFFGNIRRALYSHNRRLRTQYGVIMTASIQIYSVMPVGKTTASPPPSTSSLPVSFASSLSWPIQWGTSTFPWWTGADRFSWRLTATRCFPWTMAMASTHFPWRTATVTSHFPWTMAARTKRRQKHVSCNHSAPRVHLHELELNQTLPWMWICHVFVQVEKRIDEESCAVNL